MVAKINILPIFKQIFLTKKHAVGVEGLTLRDADICPSTI